MHNVSNNSSATAATKQRSVLRLSLLLVLLLGWCTIGVSRADIVRYNVSFNDPNAFQFDSGSSPYALDFYLSGSSGTTTITGSNFIGSGTDASTDFMLENSLADADTTRIFTPPTTSPAGSLLSFDITANSNPGSGDAFSFAIYKDFGTDNQGFIRTSEFDGQGLSFFSIDFANPSGPFVSTYSSNDSGFNIGAPTVTLVSAVATPEPETWAMMIMGLCSIVVLMKRRKKQENHPMLVEGNLLS